MLNRQQTISVNSHAVLYDILIPKGHELRLVNELVYLSFIYDELKDKYCLDDGRNAIDPVQMFKYLFLKVRADLSDRDLIERAKTDLAYKFFLGLDPEDDVIHPSLLTKFRTQRLKDKDLLDKLLAKSVEIAIEQGVLKSDAIIVDATHTASHSNLYHPIEGLRAVEKKFRKQIHQVKNAQDVIFPEKNTTSDLDVEKKYAADLLGLLDKYPTLRAYKSVTQAANLLTEMLADIHEYQSYSADEDAKIGHKSADTQFFGYKTHYALSEESIITAAVITSGEKGDGQFLPELYDKTQAAGMETKELIGDRAYSTINNLKFAEKMGVLLFSKLLKPISEGTRNPDECWDFNKDAGRVICPAGQMATRVARQGRKNAKESQTWTYYFDVERCQKCPLQDGCYRPGAKSKTYSIRILSSQHSQHKEFEQTEYFQQRVRERYRIEQKNSEIKNKHGYGRSWSNGIQGMRLQGAVTLFEANIRRIIKLKEIEKQKSKESRG